MRKRGSERKRGGRERRREKEKQKHFPPLQLLSLSLSFPPVLDLMNTGSVKITDSRYRIEVTSDQREWISGRIDLRAHTLCEQRLYVCDRYILSKDIPLPKNFVAYRDQWTLTKDGGRISICCRAVSPKWVTRECKFVLCRSPITILYVTDTFKKNLSCVIDEKLAGSWSVN